MNIPLAIEAAIKHTLVVENKQSIGYAVDKINENNRSCPSIKCGCK